MVDVLLSDKLWFFKNGKISDISAVRGLGNSGGFLAEAIDQNLAGRMTRDRTTPVLFNESELTKTDVLLSGAIKSIEPVASPAVMFPFETVDVAVRVFSEREPFDDVYELETREMYETPLVDETEEEDDDEDTDMKDRADAAGSARVVVVDTRGSVKAESSELFNKGVVSWSSVVLVGMVVVKASEYSSVMKSAGVTKSSLTLTTLASVVDSTTVGGAVSSAASVVSLGATSDWGSLITTPDQLITILSGLF